MNTTNNNNNTTVPLPFNIPGGVERGHHHHHPPHNSPGSSQNSTIGNNSTSGGRFINRIQEQEKEIQKLKAKSYFLTERVDELEKWQKSLHKWMIEYFGEDFRSELRNNNEENVQQVPSPPPTPIPQHHRQNQAPDATTQEELLTDASDGGFTQFPVIESVCSIKSNGSGMNNIKEVAPQPSEPSKSTSVSSAAELITQEPPPLPSQPASKRKRTNSERTVSVDNNNVKPTPSTSKEPVPLRKDYNNTTNINGNGNIPSAAINNEDVDVKYQIRVLTPRSTTPISQSQQLGVDPDAPCAVCDDPNEEDMNSILFCDRCNMPVHQACYGVQKIPPGKWFCNPCKLGLKTADLGCRFCSIKGGALKPVSSPNPDSRSIPKSWAHVWCVWWIPGPRMLSRRTQEPVVDLHHLDKNRVKLTCVICNVKNCGAPIECFHGRCKVAFHPSCAQRAHYKMIFNNVFDTEEELILKAYCEKHRPNDE